MAKCEFCDKGVTFGIKVSHSHRRSNRPWKPNVKRVLPRDHHQPRRHAGQQVLLHSSGGPALPEGITA